MGMNCNVFNLWIFFSAALVEPAAVSITSRRTVLIEDIWACSYSTFLKAQETGHIYAFGLNNYNQLGMTFIMFAF